MTSPNILLICLMAFLFLLWKTNSIMTSISTTQILVTLIVVGVAHKVGCISAGFIILLISMASLVWRVIPHDKVDSWDKT